MTQIILDTAQTKLVLQSHDPVRICDPEGNVIGIVAPTPVSSADESSFTPEEIAAAKRALAAPDTGRTTKEVLARLRALWPESE
jgi:hypothetical protein